ncbi:hypothetical protein MIMGU_mgv1a017314mg [Erythranthe guttata]|uniref:Uncharacterized protein n=1 Tax=Erythranthe guttata TaxID=4155 RepID=A0A022RQU7_ERYGU|nr:hypothetical protein MIMGU_mgv1a017314mg [Erythranthe guttata]
MVEFTFQTNIKRKTQTEIGISAAILTRVVCSKEIGMLLSNFKFEQRSKNLLHGRAFVFDPIYALECELSNLVAIAMAKITSF